ncbi:MAG: protein-L-isoaspartate O-methyltransferase [Thermoguttaceae bacterium]|nr:protein-L-isoaspartate O-methyltransferase [Thermoguttaceae bacterium]
MSKREIVTIIFMLLACMVANPRVDSYGAKVTIRTSQRNEAKTTKTQTSPEESETPDKNEPTDFGTRELVDDSLERDAVDKAIAPESLAVDNKSDQNLNDVEQTQTSDSIAPKQSSVKVRATPKSEEIVIPAPETPLAPLDDENRELRYPNNESAALMTLAALVPTRQLRNVRVLKAFCRVPRDEFATKKALALAYADQETVLDDGRVLPAPFTLAYMIEALNPQHADRVLTLADQSGYLAAIWSGLACETYSIETNLQQARRHAAIFERLGYRNIFLRVSDDYTSWNAQAPFDKIVVYGAMEEAPDELLEMLAPGGKLILAIGRDHNQYLTVYERQDNEYQETRLISVDLPQAFAPEKEVRQDKIGNSPQIIGGDFEESEFAPILPTATAAWKLEDKIETREITQATSKGILTPKGWRDARNATACATDDAYQGNNVCRFDNASIAGQHRVKDRNQERIDQATLPENRRVLTPFEKFLRERQRAGELACSLTQSFSLQGSSVKKLVVSGAYRVEYMTPMEEGESTRIAFLRFYDRNRRQIGEDAALLDVDSNVAPWTEFYVEVSVPARTTYAVLKLGIFNNTGVVAFDSVDVRNKYEKNKK